MRGCVGIDEVGRGPLAGPVTVCAVQWLDTRHPGDILVGIRDSKKLSPKKRNEWLLRARALEERSLRSAVCSVDSAEIDQVGIMGALRVAAAEVLRQLHMKTAVYHIYADYGLPVPECYLYTSMIKGDEKNSLIALASIIAKETRDTIMCDIGRQFPVYGFDQHKGYGTEYHRTMIHKHGVCPVHRKTFLKGLLSDS